MMITADGQERRPLPELRKQLAMMVRNTQWSYAILWTVSSTDAGVIKWGEGYYNGETRTGKTTKSQDVDTYLWGLQRSEQLKKLYEALLEGKLEQEKKKTIVSATLTVEDLSEMEWFYLVCMSYTFKFGQSLPGRAIATGQHIWLCGAQSADSKVFSRALLAKSALVQTVICFPHIGGVIEFGSTDLIPEDLKLIERIVKARQEVAETVCSQRLSCAAYCTDYDQNHRGTGATVDENDKRMAENISISSPDDCSIDCSHHLEELLMLDGSLSPCQNRLSHYNPRQCLQESTNGYVGRSMLFADSENTQKLCMEVVQHGRSKTPQIETAENIHCRKSLPVTLESMDRIVEDRNRFHSQHRTCNEPFYGLDKERETEQVMILRSMVPSVTKTDEASILSIESPGELEARLDELNGMDLEGSSTKNGLFMLENTSDSYKMDVSYANVCMNNRKGSDQINETQIGVDKAIQTEVLRFIDIEVLLINDEVLVEVNCPWRDSLLLDIMKILNNLNLDTHTVQSSTYGGTLFLSLKSKFRGAEFVSEAMIRQALRRTISNHHC